MGYLWFQKEDNVYTIGINEDGLDEIETINTVDLPPEGEQIEADVVCGSVETDDGPLDIYSPVSGKVIEINTAVVEDPALIQEDPYDGWLLKIESHEEYEDSDSDDSDDEDEDEDEEDEDEGQDEDLDPDREDDRH
ncbi:MAG: glycine cleavage system protein H [Bdellovibrio sp.]|nr:MAG: glycine cleavage system protein H [Bdellovibrio sp.]